jgi:hypothetical protein
MKWSRREARHARACPGHPRLSCWLSNKTWMAGTSPAMTKRRIVFKAHCSFDQALHDDANACGTSISVATLRLADRLAEFCDNVQAKAA